MFKPTCKYPKGSIARTVIEYATEEFYAKGIKKVSMADIAKELHMSKATIYSFFETKQALILACIEHAEDLQHEHTYRVYKEGGNVLVCILAALDFRTSRIEGITQEYIGELANIPSVMKYVRESHERSKAVLVDFYRMGVREGLFRADTNISILLGAFYAQLESEQTIRYVEEYGIRTCFFNIGLLHLRGCCTPKGEQIVDEFIESYKLCHDL